MGSAKARKQAASLKRALAEQGRSVTWLAEAMGYSRAYVSNILNEKQPFTEKFQRRALDAMRARATVPVTYRGQTIHVAEDVYRRAGEADVLIAVESSYEEAWKRAWLQEHAQSTLAAAADRAFQAAKALEAA